MGATATATDAATPPAERPEGRGRRLAHLLALTAFVFAQPLLDITGRSPDFFLYRRTTSLELAALVALIALAPPLALWLVEVAVGLASRTAERVTHLVFVGGLFAVLAVEVGKRVDISFVMGKRLLAVAIVGGIAAAVLVGGLAPLRQALVYASPAPLVFVLVFALTTPAGALLRPAREADAAVAASQAHPPVVMMIFDELPTRALLDARGQVDARLFPHFAELAGTSTWYSRTSAVTGYTPFAVPALMTGKYPRKRLAPSYVQFPNNLFTLLGDAYDIRAAESITQLCPPSVCTNALPAGRDTGLGAIVSDVLGVAKEVVSPYKAPPREGAEFAEEPELAAHDNDNERFKFAEGAKNQPERLTTFLAGLGRDVDKPTLDFLHILLPHVPFRYTPSGTEYRNPPADFPLGRTKETDVYRINEEPGAALVQQQRMLMQLAYTDTLLGLVIARLKETKMWDDAMVVVTSDHGEGFTPDENVRHFDDNNMAEVAYVPFFVKMPDQQAPEVDPRHVQHVDVLPTLADLLGVKLRFKVDGQSALAGSGRTTTQRAWYDNPNEPRPFDGARFEPRLASGFAHEIARVERGPRGLFAFGEHAGLVGKPLADLTIGAPSPVKATQGSKLGFENAEPSKGKAQALLWGGLDRAPAERTTWLVASVNGTVAGVILAARSRVKGTWHYTGMVDDAYYKDGRNDVRLWAVDGTTLHAIEWRR